MKLQNILAVKGIRLFFDFLLFIPSALCLAVCILLEKREYKERSSLKNRLWWILAFFAGLLLVRAMVGLFFGIGAGQSEELIPCIASGVLSVFMFYLLFRWRLRELEI